MANEPPYRLVPAESRMGEVWQPRTGANSFAPGKQICPLPDGKGWFILGDAAMTPYESSLAAAEELQRQWEDARSGAQR